MLEKCYMDAMRVASFRAKRAVDQNMPETALGAVSQMAALKRIKETTKKILDEYGVSDIEPLELSPKVDEFDKKLEGLTLGQSVYLLIREQGFTQREFARRASLSTASISAIITGCPPKTSIRKAEARVRMLAKGFSWDENDFRMQILREKALEEAKENRKNKIIK